MKLADMCVLCSQAHAGKAGELNHAFNSVCQAKGSTLQSGFHVRAVRLWLLDSHGRNKLRSMTVCISLSDPRSFQTHSTLSPPPPPQRTPPVAQLTRNHLPLPPQLRCCSGIVVQVGLLLGLHSDDALVEVFVVHLCGVSSEGQHACLHAHRLHGMQASGTCGSTAAVHAMPPADQDRSPAEAVAESGAPMGKARSCSLYAC